MTDGGSEWLALISSTLAAIGGATAMREYGRLFTREGRLRDKIDRDLELIERMDWDSDGKKDLQKTVDRRVARLAAKRRRHWEGATVAALAFCGLVAFGLCAAALKWQGWWSWPLGIIALFFVLVAIVGLVSDRESADDGAPQPDLQRDGL